MPRMLLLAATLPVALAALAACGPAAPTGAKAGSTSASPALTTPAAKDPSVTIEGDEKKIAYNSPVTLSVEDGSFTSASVGTTGDTPAPLEGTVSADGKTWVSSGNPRPSATYLAVATVKDTAGTPTTKNLNFAVTPVPESKRLAFTVTPGDGSTVGIGQPIVVRFLSAVTHRADLEKAMRVDARKPSGQHVKGSWHWLNSQQADWRPESFWTPGTKVGLDLKIAGVKAAKGRYGRKDYSQSFTIGASHITRVNASTDRVKVYRDGKLVHTWLTGTGRRGLETYSGTYIVLSKSAVEQMDSCSARVTCDKKDPDYYDEKEYWATRVTASGTFLHAASWDGLLGRANTSHGCIHLSDANAKDFFEHAVKGDVVIVSKTGRGPQQRIDTQDPGLYDWNLTWKQWTDGSAL